ncbi:hypothetical protein [Acidithiobacillus concretivorus]|uniref:Nucleotidyl transferase AbiEii/AbiGii toxin family protein n=1 Tax=Acidithiobacillus concretivorus TaxID=3063952 RepID=A0ABS5ZML9_9PROT|nr:hypothetical protein [Acidithiobacillus concretivorus]MBU2737891.1 hypothetical protein [Acidithiobacillus concretivorus]
MKHKDFNRYVDMAMAGRGLDAMRPVVEKELLHYELFNALDSEGLLKNLVFHGGTSLRLCRGSDRFREVVPLRMNYSVLDGVSPTLVVAESIHEILTEPSKR